MNALALALSLLLFQDKPGTAADVEKLKAELDRKAALVEALQRQLDSANQKLQDREKAAASARALEQRKELDEDEKKLPALRALRAIQPAVAPLPLPAPATPQWDLHVLGRITAIANEISLAVISLGSDDGVRDGDEFTIQRQDQEVGRLKVDRADRKWSAGKFTGSARNGDEVRRTGLKDTLKWVVQTKPLPLPSAPSAELQSLRKELDEVRAQVRQLSDKLVPSWQGSGVSVEETPEELRAHLGILRGLLVRRVREGSPAERMGLKPNDVVPDLLEAQLIEAIETGMPIPLVRQGQRIKIQGAKGR